MENRDPAVDAWFENYANPQKDLVQSVRSVILEADPRMSETIKWQAPTGLLEGEGDKSRVAKVRDEADLAAKADGLRGLVAAWIELKG